MEDQEHILGRLDSLLRQYEIQGQFSVPFMLRQIELVRSNEDNLLKQQRIIDGLSQQLSRCENEKNQLEHRVENMELQVMLLLEVITGRTTFRDGKNSELKADIEKKIDRFRARHSQSNHKHRMI